MKYFRKNLGDWMTATRHLSMTERGAYNELMDAYYSTEQALPAEFDALCRIAGAQSKVERDAVKKVAALFFESREGRLFQARIENEIVLASEAGEKNRENGAKPKRVAKPVASNSHSNGLGIQEPIDSNQPTSTPKPPPAAFALPLWIPAEAWSDFEAMRRQQRKPLSDAAKRLAVKALEDLRRHGSDPQLVLEQSVMRCWLGLFEVKPDARAAVARGGLPWWSTDEGIIAAGKERNLEPRPGETMQTFKGRVSAAMEVH